MIGRYSRDLIPVLSLVSAPCKVTICFSSVSVTVCDRGHVIVGNITSFNRDELAEMKKNIHYYDKNILFI